MNILSKSVSFDSGFGNRIQHHCGAKGHCAVDGPCKAQTHLKLNLHNAACRCVLRWLLGLRLPAVLVLVKAGPRLRASSERGACVLMC